MSQHVPLSEQLRNAVLNCGQTQAEIVRATGIDKTSLYRFLAGERFASPRNLDILGKYLGLRVVADGPKRKPKAKKGK
ncbi:MAG TPA: helix-turn-helix transcriptional regulator [Thermoguttaceae bacterium]|nr:helix-turn-helix transcriptional regulator [Thermoguttaceae bacterium]